MTRSETIIHLTPNQFEHRILVESNPLRAVTFRYGSGVCGLELSNDTGELILLPFQGQQIWSATLGGRVLTMKSMFDQPYPTRDFLSTFGGFLHHCGATAMGAPGPDDNHPLHGELPNAPYQTAAVLLGEDEHGSYIGLTGTYRHTVAFNYNYIAQPRLKLYAGQSVFRLSMEITNLKQTPMPLMYLVHANFRPVDHGRLLYSAPSDTEHMHVRADVPDFMEVSDEYRAFVKELAAAPEKHMRLEPGLAFDPEVVLTVDCQADETGWAQALQVHPKDADGHPLGTDVVRYRPDQFKHMVRWICRTADQDALGFEPATAGVSGFTAEKEKGNVRTLGPGETARFDLELGALTAAEAKEAQAELATYAPG